jgi:predicted phosphodiesterase
MELERIQNFLLKTVGKRGCSLSFICDKLNIKDYELLGVIELLKQNGALLDVIDGNVYKLAQPKQAQDVYVVPSKLETVKLLAISDTHFCSKYDRLDIMRYLADKANNKGVNYILHSGDFTDGVSNRPEHIYELKEQSFEGQVDYCVENYPQFNGTTYAIGGNHDGWHYKRCGSDVVKAIAKQRDDIIYLGPDVADLKIGKLKIRLFHGKGGNAYALSYKLQKYADSIPQAEKPDILQTGHIHRSFYMNYDGTHCFQTSALIDNTPFARSMGFPNEKSCWWITVHMDSNGNPIIIEPQLETFGDKVLKKKR